MGDLSMECFFKYSALEVETSPNQNKNQNNLNMIWKVFSRSNFHMTSLIMPFQCAEVVIGQAGWVISHPGLTLEHLIKYINLDGVYDKQKIDFLANG